MPQTLAATPQAIYDVLVADATFMAEVGEYTFASGDTAPSISIVTPGADLPPVRSQSGLEVVIHDAGDMDSMLFLSGPSEAIFTWKIFLIVWTPANGSTSTTAIQRIVQLFPQAKSIETVSVNSTLGVDFQTKVLIPSNCPILT
jgi:hypothetical protein